MSDPVRIVIVGGGIAGLLLATRLGDQLGRTGRAHVTLIDRSPTHVWKPLLHTIAAGTRDVQQQQVIFLAHAREHGFTFQPGDMQGLDRARRRVQLGEIGQFGFFRGGFIRGRFAQFSHLMLYRRHQHALHGFSKATLLWIAERINGCVQPRIRLS
ncbi:hypothetical protein [Burkholderia stagnalis]